jgi:hypothetical protein
VDHLPWFGDTNAIVREIDPFLRSILAEEAEFEQVLATAMFTDMVGSTQRASQMGDRPASRRRGTSRNRSSRCGCSPRTESPRPDLRLRGGGTGQRRLEGPQGLHEPIDVVTVVVGVQGDPEPARSTAADDPGLGSETLSGHARIVIGVP